MSAVDVHTVVSGPVDGPVVVLSNSLGSTHRMWDAQLAELEERFRVVRYDTRGHGRSPVPDGTYSIDDLADDLVALLDRLGVERAQLVGLSLGGMTAMRVASRNPERVDRLALLCTGAQLPPATAWTDRAATVRAEGTEAVAAAVVERWFTAEYLDSHPDVRTGHEPMVASTPAEGYAGCCEAIAKLDLREELSAISAPTLAIAGEDDPATPPAKLEEIAAGIPGANCLSCRTPRTWRTPNGPTSSPPPSSNTWSNHDTQQGRGISRRGRRRHSRRRQPGRRRLRAGRHPVVPHRGAAGAGRGRPHDREQQLRRRRRRAGPAVGGAQDHPGHRVVRRREQGIRPAVPRRGADGRTHPAGHAGRAVTCRR